MLIKNFENMYIFIRNHNVSLFVYNKTRIKNTQVDVLETEIKA